MKYLLPLVQYFAYIEIGGGYDYLGVMQNHTLSQLWFNYKALTKEFPHLRMKEIEEVPDIWKVFKELFGKEE